MKKSLLKKLNSASTAEGVERAVLAAGYAPFEEGDIEGLTLMTIFKAKERHTARRKKEDGFYVKLQSFTSPEGAENFDFVALSRDIKRAKRGEDGKKFEPVECRIYAKRGL